MIDLLHHPDDLLKLAHELRAILEPAGGVHQHDIRAFGARARDRVEGEARRVGAGLARDDRGAGAAGPDAQLLDRRGAEGVAGSQHHLEAVGRELGRELADGGGLAGAVDADDQDHKRLSARVDGERPRDGLKRALDLGREDALDLVGADPLLVAPAGDRLADARRRAEPKVGLDENVLEIVEGSGVELALGEDVGETARDVR